MPGGFDGTACAMISRLWLVHALRECKRESVCCVRERVRDVCVSESVYSFIQGGYS